MIHHTIKLSNGRTILFRSDVVKGLLKLAITNKTNSTQWNDVVTLTESDLIELNSFIAEYLTK